MQNKLGKYQQGFINARQGLDNVIALDTRSRIADAIGYNKGLARIGHQPCLVLFDILAAFPSLCHEFILILISFLQFPTGLVLFIVALYTDNAAYGSCEGVLTFLYKIESGILQGFPSAARSSRQPWISSFA